MDLDSRFIEADRRKVLHFWTTRQKGTCCICVQQTHWHNCSTMPPRLRFELMDLRYSEPDRVDNYRAAHAGCIEFLKHLNAQNIKVDICDPDYKPEWFRKVFKRRRHRQRQRERQLQGSCKIAAE